MLPTPSTSHVNHDRIYEPAEDSFLLLDTLSSQAEIDFVSTRFPERTSPPLVVEVGTGSGVVLAFVAAHAGKIFGRPDVACLGIDINSFACEATVETLQIALSDARKIRDGSSAAFLDSVVGDLTTQLRPRSVDVLIFNPPYVPTEALPATTGPEDGKDSSALGSHASFERDSYLLSLSYAGGVDGMETTNRLLDAIPDVLSTRGVAYVLLCAQNKPDQVIDKIYSWSESWSAQKVGTSGKTAGWERLCILRICRRDAP